MLDTEHLPADVSDDEKLARAIFHPFHIKKNKLKSAAFKAPSGRNDVSVNRLLALTSNQCKQKAKEIERKPHKVFRGFAVISAGNVRELGSDVLDSRDPPNYFGHADIIHDIVLEKDQAAPPEFNHRLNKMAKAARFHSDADPDGDTWNGDDLTADLPE